MIHFWLTLEAIRFLWKRRKDLRRMLDAGQELVLRVHSAQPDVIAMLHVTDPSLHRAMCDFVNLLRPSTPIRIIGGEVEEGD